MAFVLLPFICQHIKRRSMVFHSTVVVGSAVITGRLMFLMSPYVAMLYVATQTVLVFICPWWLLHIEKFKTKINGPWDEAVPKLTKIVQEHSLQNQALR